MGEPLRPYLPAIGRFLIVVTFIEDAIRIITQWNDQLTYLRDFRHIPWGLTHLFLIFNVITMSVCSVLVIMRRYGEYAVGGLLSVVVVQALGYGLIFDLNFFLRNLSVIGGLLMVLGDSFVKKTRVFAGLPSIDEKDKKMYIQLGGRVLLIFLFIVLVNNFWTLHHNHPHKDFAKYDFFQILSIMGGLLLLVNMGPGQLSVDEKKKVY